MQQQGRGDQMQQARPGQGWDCGRLLQAYSEAVTRSRAIMQRWGDYASRFKPLTDWLSHAVMETKSVYKRLAEAGRLEHFDQGLAEMMKRHASKITDLVNRLLPAMQQRRTVQQATHAPQNGAMRNPQAAPQVQQQHQNQQQVNPHAQAWQGWQQRPQQPQPQQQPQRQPSQNQYQQQPPQQQWPQRQQNDRASPAAAGTWYQALQKHLEQCEDSASDQAQLLLHQQVQAAAAHLVAKNKRDMKDINKEVKQLKPKGAQTAFRAFHKAQLKQEMRL